MHLEDQRLHLGSRRPSLSFLDFNTDAREQRMEQLMLCPDAAIESISRIGGGTDCLLLACEGGGHDDTPKQIPTKKVKMTIISFESLVGGCAQSTNKINLGKII